MLMKTTILFLASLLSVEVDAAKIAALSNNGKGKRLYGVNYSLRYGHFSNFFCNDDPSPHSQFKFDYFGSFIT